MDTKNSLPSGLKPPIRNRFGSTDQKNSFVNALFDRTAKHYDRAGAVGFLGTGNLYRKRMLEESGLAPDDDVIDVACGTGAVTRQIAKILEQGKGSIIAVDPSRGMLEQAKILAGVEFHEGHAEALPVKSDTFDFLSMGYALRHVDDLNQTFREFRRVLKPGGTALILEVSTPQTAWGFRLARAYFGHIAPTTTWITTGSRDAREMMRYYWETIEACVPPDEILSALRDSGFKDVERKVELGVFSAYRAKA